MQFVKNGEQVKHLFKQLYGSVTLSQVSRYNQLIKWFNDSFGGEGCYICSSSGRVELVGNHTDHNGGRVMGCTVNLDILAGFMPTDDNTVVIKSKGYKDISFTLDEIDLKEVNSAGMAKGVLKGFAERGYAIGGFKVCMTSTVAGGAGISSSAAYELLIGQIVNNLYNEGKVTPEELAQIGQFSEKTDEGLLGQIFPIDGIPAVADTVFQNICVVPADKQLHGLLVTLFHFSDQKKIRIHRNLLSRR